MRHSKQDGEIRWSLENGGGLLRVYVEDGGPGIPDDEIPLVTNRFFRGRNKSPIGSGLGLSIVELTLKVNRARLVLRNRNGISGLRAEIVFGGSC